MKTRILKAAALCGLFVFGSISKYNAQSFSETFDDITLLAGNGWVMTNASVPVGATNWFQGTAVPTGPFDAYNGAANAYIGANYNNTGSTGTISNWLMTPNRTFRNGDVITFYTRKSSPDSFADRLEVRLSTNGASTNVGTGLGVGDYTTLLLSINPTLVLGVYPTAWTQYTITISGLPAPTSGRIAFRYFVEGGGSLGTRSDYIGIDQVDYTPYVCPSFTMTTGGALTGGAAGSVYSLSLTQTGALGAPNFAITAGALPPGLTLSASGTISGTPTATGTFNFTATVNDASGCSGSQSYSITVVCPANPITLSTAPALCDNSGSYTLVQGSPAGGTYSGTGVTGGGFDPAAGTQTITYDYTDPYGCAYNAGYTITVNAAPAVSLTPISAICDNSGILALTGGSPAGGIFSGTGVSGTDFDPAAGTQTVTYTYTDANNCTNAVNATITVNIAPAVTQSAISAVCDNALPLALSGGSPVSGTYSGTGVTLNAFDPSVGTQTVTYTYTDVNNCTNEATTTITVNTAPTVTQSAISAVCDNSGTLALTGGSPVGGTYSGTGVTGTDFDPAAGTQTVTYTYIDTNNCSNDATATITVNTAPTVTQSAISAICDNSGTLALTGASPVGGTYSGTGVTGTDFDPAAGTQTVTYTYIDTNNCSNDATATITVNTAPTVTQSAISAVCDNSGTLALTGGSPAGGTYSGTGVTGTDFDPAAGTQTVTYTYIDTNNCSNDATAMIMVNSAPTVAYTSPVANLCLNHVPLTLTGGSPAGGTYSGTGVSGGVLNPATAGAGNHVITYTYTDTNGCDGQAAFTINVSACLGLEENTPDSGLEVYPNPTTGKFTVSTTSGAVLSIVNVMDVQGKTVPFGSSKTSGVMQEIDFSNQVPGLYFVNAVVDGQSITFRIQKNN